jgi:putative transposase
MLKAYKYRLYPTNEQAQKIDQSIGACRFVYNLALETKLWAYKTQRINLSSFDLCYQLVELKNAYSWLKQVDSQALQVAVKNIEKAFNGFFSGNGYPKFKKKINGVSFSCPGNKKEIDWSNSTLTIPKIKYIPIVLSRPFKGDIKTVTISKRATGKYFASILVDNKTNLPTKSTIDPKTTIGIDVGIKNLIVCSDGRVFGSAYALKNNIERLRILQRRASKKVKGSKNRKKASLRVARLHERITNARLDSIHKITTQLMNDNQVQSIVIENLNVSGLILNHKLARSLNDASFSELFRQLKYKADWYGKNLIVIGRFLPSSKKCSKCGHVKKVLLLSERNWKCESCNTEHDRDLNAAINIQQMGLNHIIFNNNTGVGNSGVSVEKRTRVRSVKRKGV